MNACVRACVRACTRVRVRCYVSQGATHTYTLAHVLSYMHHSHRPAHISMNTLLTHIHNTLTHIRISHTCTLTHQLTLFFFECLIEKHFICFHFVCECVGTGLSEHPCGSQSSTFRSPSSSSASAPEAGLGLSGLAALPAELSPCLFSLMIYPFW